MEEVKKEDVCLPPCFGEYRTCLEWHRKNCVIATSCYEHREELKKDDNK